MILKDKRNFVNNSYYKIIQRAMFSILCVIEFSFYFLEDITLYVIRFRMYNKHVFNIINVHFIYYVSNKVELC